MSSLSTDRLPNRGRSPLPTWRTRERGKGRGGVGRTGRSPSSICSPPAGVSVAYRRNFTRYYDIVERVIPEEHLLHPEPSVEEAQRTLLLQAARALGVGTARDIIDYFWMSVDQARRILRQMVDEGKLIAAQVEGWSQPAYLHPAAVVPREVAAWVLINPFDTYMWNRERVERLHDFFYRIEIYVPEPKRVHGYYVFPFLLGEHLVGRIDLKADRKAGVLRVPGAFLEDGADPARVAGELAAELTEMAQWLGLGEIAAGRMGDLVGRLRRAL